MKKYIVLRLIVVGVLASALLMLVTGYIQLDAARDSYNKTAELQLEQLEEILIKNDQDILILQDDLKEEYIVRAKAAAYILSKNPEIIHDSKELAKILSLLQIDEIHLFDKEGVLFAGTIPEYYNVDMYSGEQIGFFLPMLEDTELELAQDVTPNTVEKKEMQYVAVWNEDKEHIVQVGLEPLRLLEAIGQNELEYLFSNMIPTPGTTLMAIEAHTGYILASTNPDLNGFSMSNYGDFDLENADGTTITTRMYGSEGITTFKTYGDIVLGINEDTSSIYGLAYNNVLVVILSAIFISALIITLIYLLLDNKVLSGIESLNRGMSKIAAGETDFKLSVSGLPEFEALSENVNSMVKSVADSSGRLSTALKYINIPIAVYQHRQDTVNVTSKMGEILEIQQEAENDCILNINHFIEIINDLKSNPYHSEKDIYSYNIEGGTKYLKHTAYEEGSNHWGIILDVTEEINEKQSIRHERDIDFLTGIYNRRAFLEHVSDLVHDNEMLKTAVIVMMDLDNLKHVNDSWGHIYGDKYICTAADVLRNFNHTEKLCARFSGDEFVIMLYGADNEEQLSPIITELKTNFDDAYILNPDREKYPVKISGGYAFYPNQSKDFKEILHLADTAMYQVKHGKKGEFKRYV